METKIFNGKKIKVREISKGDLKNVKKFQDFINSLVKEDAMIKLNKKQSLREETEWLRGKLKQIKNKKEVALIAECENKIVGNSQINLDWGRQSHIGDFGISIRRGYRNIGLGTYLAKEVIKLAKKELKPRPKIIKLSVYAKNKPVIEFYKNLGFKEVARIPKQGKIKGKLVDEIIMLLEI
jgi:ribosomal protein S18 acetylase RimI-like enzyme